MCVPVRACARAPACSFLITIHTHPRVPRASFGKCQTLPHLGNPEALPPTSFYPGVCVCVCVCSRSYHFLRSKAEAWEAKCAKPRGG